MAPRDKPDDAADLRRSADRRAKPRPGKGTARGRRASDRPAADETATAARKRRSTRDGREPLVIYLRPESIKALKIAALEDDTTASAIMTDALGAWFRERGRPARR